jgi:two-component system KDP operon response regulator KdpE
MNNKGARILVIDDEIQIRRLLKVALLAHGYVLELCPDAAAGLNRIVGFKPDLIILDLGLPDMDGLDVVQAIRQWSKTPILILSAKEHENEKVKALDLGADDYITKPFGMGELLARIRVALRHAGKDPDEPVLKFDNLLIDRDKRLVTVDDQEIKLTPTEYDLLTALATNGGRVLTQSYLLNTIWGPYSESNAHYLRIYIGQLRRKIEEEPSKPHHIITEPGIGYRLV